MSLLIEDTDELLTLLKKMDLKVHNVEELHRLLATINANYNADAARQKTGKLIAVAVPGIMAGAAAFASFFLLGGVFGGQSQPPTVQHMPFVVGGLAVIWVSVAVVSTAAVIAGSITTRVRRDASLSDHPTDRPGSRGQSVVTHITRELPS